MYYYPRRFRVIGFCRILFILANEMRVMGLISPIDKNARDIHSTTHVLASWRIFPVQAFFFLFSNLHAFCFLYLAFLQFSLFVSVGLFASLQGKMAEKRKCKIRNNNEENAVNASRRRPSPELRQSFSGSDR